MRWGLREAEASSVDSSHSCLTLSWMSTSTALGTMSVGIGRGLVGVRTSDQSEDRARWSFRGGGAICGMHYLGDASISNYRCSYNIANVVGAAVIAPSASTAALSLFFVFTNAWTDSILRRIGCAFILAGAVSGMYGRDWA